MMKHASGIQPTRRHFLTSASVSLIAAHSVASAQDTDIDLKECVIVLSEHASAHEKKDATVLVEEVQKRSALRWRIDTVASEKSSAVAIYLGTRSSLKNHSGRLSSAASAQAVSLTAEGFLIEPGSDPAN